MIEALANLYESVFFVNITPERCYLLSKKTASYMFYRVLKELLKNLLFFFAHPLFRANLLSNQKETFSHLSCFPGLLF